MATATAIKVHHPLLDTYDPTYHRFETQHFNIPVKSDVTVVQFKQMAYTDFWNRFPDIYPNVYFKQHGSAKNISLKTDKKVEISDDITLRKFIGTTAAIDIIVVRHPQPPSKMPTTPTSGATAKTEVKHE